MAETTFAQLGISEAVVASLGEQGFSEPFPIQTATIEAALAGRDICGKAPTGSGKTLAFGIPVIDLVGPGEAWMPSGLILAPTRELASQIKDELAPLAQAKGLRVVTVFGGTNIERDIHRLREGVDILVACPGRLEDLIARRCCELRQVKMVVVDEADRMADMGFLPSVKRLLDQTPDKCHTLLFSATLDGDVDMLIKRYQTDPLTFEVEAQVEDLGHVEHSWHVVQPGDRTSSTVDVLRRFESSIVFCRTRKGCDRVAQNFKRNGLAAVAIHGDRSQSQRERALADFTSGRAQILVATDVAARGIHVDNVALVMHYDPAGSDKDYIHRSGRTGRAGQDGRVISMIVEDKQKLARQLQKDLGVIPQFSTLMPDHLGPVLDWKPTKAPKQDDQRRGPKTSNRSERDRDRNDRKQRDRSERDSGEGRERNPRRERDDRNRGPRGRNDRDDRGGNRGKNQRDDRRPDGKPKTPRRRPGSNDWFPKGFEEEDRRSIGKNRGEKGRPGKGQSSKGQGPKKRTGSSKRNDDEATAKPAGGSNSVKRKDRNTKGRHADKKSTKNKGKRRPRSFDG